LTKCPYFFGERMAKEKPNQLCFFSKKYVNNVILIM